MTKLIIPFREFANTPKDEFYLYGSVHRWSILIIFQRDITQGSLFIILQIHSTCFGCQPHQSSGVQKTVTTAFGTGHHFCVVTSPRRGQATMATLEGSSCTVPEAVVTALCTPNGGCGWHPKHVEWTYKIINRLLCVASCWTIMNIRLKIYTKIIRPFQVTTIHADGLERRLRIFLEVRVYVKGKVIPLQARCGPEGG